MKKTILLSLLICVLNVGLANTAPNNNADITEVKTIADNSIEELQTFLTPFKDEELTDVSVLLIPVFYLSEIQVFENPQFNLGNKDLNLKLEDRINFIFKVPESKYLKVWHQFQHLAFQDRDIKPHPYLNFILSIRFTFADKVLYASIYREDKTSLSLATGEQRIFLTLESLDTFADIASPYIEHPLLKEALYEEIQPQRGK